MCAWVEGGREGGREGVRVKSQDLLDLCLDLSFEHCGQYHFPLGLLVSPTQIK